MNWHEKKQIVINKWLSVNPLLRIASIIFIILIFVILWLPFLFTLPSFLGLDFTKTGQIGDTIGGTLGPFIAIIAAALTFLAFWVQYEANEQQRNDISKERFQNKFFELLKLHKENVNSISTNNRYNKDFFTGAFEQLKTTYKLVEKFYLDFGKSYPNEKRGSKKTDEENILTVAYLLYWLGDNEDSRKFINQYLIINYSHKFVSELFAYTELTTNKYFGYILKPRKERPSKSLYVIYYSNSGKLEIVKLEKKPFQEHSSVLGHYYRLLFQIIKFIDDQDSKSFSDKEKYQYAKNLRSLLSNHEQLLLFYNALSPFGEPWLNVEGLMNHMESYLLKYKLIKNIPIPLANIGIRPEEKFQEEIQTFRKKVPSEELFEWHEITKRS